jgi:hypothetical protein
MIVGIQHRLAEQLPAADQNGWIAGRPVTITPLDQQTIELVFHGVPQVSEAEVRAVRRVLEMPTFCSVSPESADTLRVTFLCHEPRRRRATVSRIADTRRGARFRGDSVARPSPAVDQRDRSGGGGTFEKFGV